MEKVLKLLKIYADEIVGCELYMTISSEDGSGYVETGRGDIMLSFKDIADIKYQLGNEVNRKE